MRAPRSASVALRCLAGYLRGLPAPYSRSETLGTATNGLDNPICIGLEINGYLPAECSDLGPFASVLNGRLTVVVLDLRRRAGIVADAIVYDLVDKNS